MVIEFRIEPHSVRPGISAVEIIQDGVVVGVMYPTDTGVKLVSAHFSKTELDPGFEGKVVHDDGTKKFPPIPAFEISFKPRRYYIQGNKIVYVE